jgi:hypothetical protein
VWSWLGPSSKLQATVAYLASVDPISWPVKLVSQDIHELTQHARARATEIAAAPYFQRTWIIQEYALEKSIVFFAGSAWLNVVGNLIMSLWSDHTILSQIIRYRSSEHRSRNRPLFTSLDSLLYTFCGTICDNPLDSVYALQGLLDEDARCETDYSLSPLQLYWRIVTSNLTHETGNSPFETQSRAQGPGRALGLSRLQISRHLLRDRKKSWIYTNSILDEGLSLISERVDGNFDVRRIVYPLTVRRDAIMDQCEKEVINACSSGRVSSSPNEIQNVYELLQVLVMPLTILLTVLQLEQQANPRIYIPELVRFQVLANPILFCLKCNIYSLIEKWQDLALKTTDSPIERVECVMRLVDIDPIQEYERLYDLIDGPGKYESYMQDLQGSKLVTHGARAKVTITPPRHWPNEFYQLCWSALQNSVNVLEALEVGL